MGRLKTGTPPRLKADTIDYTKCQVQKGDDPPLPFSFMNDSVWIDVSGFNSPENNTNKKTIAAQRSSKLLLNLYHNENRGYR